MRADGRNFDEIRQLKIDPFYLPIISNSVLVECGNTRVVCCATEEKGVAPWLKGKGKGWVTAEYGMLPKSSPERIKRERNSVSGRTQEIQRLIGRSLRAVVNLQKLGEKTINIDCDVIQADGGTRTASVTGGFVALSILLNDMRIRGDINDNPINENVCAISVGKVAGNAMIDLNYAEDSTAGVDMNIVMTSSLKLVELQGTGEDGPFSREDVEIFLNLAEQVVPGIVEKQNQAVAAWIERKRKEYGSF